MKNLFIKCSIAILAFMVGTCVYLATASKHVELWKKDNGQQVYFNGQLSKGSLVYRRTDGVRLLRTAEDGAWYVYEEQGPVYYCSSFELGSRQVLSAKLPGYLYTWRRDTYPCFSSIVAMDRPGFVFQPHRIEFNSKGYNRIWITW